MKRRNKTVSAVVFDASKAHPVLSIATILCTVLSVSVSLLPPLFLGRIVDNLSGGISVSAAAVVIYFLSLALEGIFSAAQEALLELFGQKMTHALRTEMSAKLSCLPTGVLRMQEPGQIAARFSGDVDTVETLFTSGVISMAADACRILSILAVIAAKNPGLFLILLLMIPGLLIFTRFVQKKMLHSQLENRKAVAAIAGQVPETVHCIRTIQLLNLESYMEQRYDRKIRESYGAVEKTNFYDAVYSPVILVLNAAVVGIVMLLSASGSSAVLRFFGMSVGTAVAMINYIGRIFTPIESLGMEIQTIQSALAGVKRIDEFLAQPEREKLPAEAVPCTREGRLEFSHVTFGYDERKVLSDCSFTVESGEQVTFIGRTGAGKSTIFRLLLGLYPPDSGTVKIDGVDASQIPDHMRRSWICCVEQNFSRIPGTVLEQITLGDPAVNREMAINAAGLAGLDGTIRSFPHGYDTDCTDDLFSQGEWQLLSIARAAASNPRILLLDEITANLDAETEARVLRALHRACEGRTVLSISHRLQSSFGGRTIEVKGQ